MVRFSRSCAGTSEERQRVKVIGADLVRGTPGERAESTVVLIDEAGAIATVRRVPHVPGVAETISELAAGEPFLVGVNLPVVVPGRASRGRPVENLVRRRFGLRLRPGGRAALSSQRTGVGGEALLAGLAAAGHPCLPYPDRDRRQSGLAEIHAELVLKGLLWEKSGISHAAGNEQRAELFRAFTPPAYRIWDTPKRAVWAERAGAMELALQALGGVEGYDFRAARELLLQAASDGDVERAGSLLDAALLAGTARRYLESPEACLFLGDRDEGYVIMPADGFVRRLALRDARPQRGRLFPRASLRDKLSAAAQLRPLDLVKVDGAPQRMEASFREPPLYEFDNLDEMLWWKHCRHLAGPTLPLEGLQELTVELGERDPAAGRSTPLRLSRSRHRTLSFRFDPPTQWRTRLPTRDGKTYPFRVLRAVYDTLPADAG